MLIPVVLSGGAGSRLWPLSRELHPKQLLPLLGERTMLQETLRRLDGVDGVGAPIVVCNEAHRFMVAEQLRQIDVAPAAILLEPVGRNTAPAVAIAALTAQELAGSDDDPILLVLPADHAIGDTAAFQRAVVVAVAAARTGKLVTFGVPPRAPETGFGYIKIRRYSEDPLTRADAYDVERFVEKPDAATARKYVDSKQYFWNSGMFVFRASRYLDELRHLAPEILETCRRSFFHSGKDLDFVRLDEETFASCPADSIDYAIMEKTDSAALVLLDAHWSDVGNWNSLCEASGSDQDGNVLVGDVVSVGSSNCYVYADHRLVATVGLEDYVVIETSDAVLVTPKDRVQDVKEVVSRLKKQDRGEALLHREVFRPWGSYDSIDAGERFQVKRITVKPGGRLSLQMHHHRAEHWIVVRGTAEVTRGEEVFLLTENQSTYIPIGTMHRLVNPGSLPLELIEVQSGAYLGEDDIVRVEDTYGRK